MNTAYTTLLSAFYTRRFLWVLAILFTLAWFGVLDYRHLVASDEGRYGEIAREMYATGDWVTPRYNGYKYFEKPPLQAWMTAIAYTLFGVGEWQSRLWTGITGYVAILATGFTAWKLVGGERGVLAGWVSAILLASSPMWNVGGHFNTLDMGLSSILSCALFALLLAQRAGLSVTARRNWMWLCWAFMALAVLSKGLIGLVIPGMVLVVYTLTTWDWGLWKRLHLFSGLVVFFLIATPWFVLVSLKNPEFPHFFFIHEHWDRFTKDGHNRKGHPLYFVPLILVGFIPWLAQLGQGLMAAWRDRRGTNTALEVSATAGFRPLWLCAVWIVMIFLFFSKSQSKLPGYIMPIFPALGLLAGLALTHAIERMSLSDDNRRWKRQMVYLTLLLLIGFIGVPYTYQLGKAPYEQLEYQQYAVWIAAGLVAALFILVSAWTVLRGFTHADAAHRLRKLMDSFLRAAIAFFVLIQAVGLGHDTHGRSISGADLAKAVAPYIQKDAPVYSIRMLDHTFPFYIQHPTIMVDMQDELEFGINQEPDTWAPKVSDFAVRWKNDDAPVVVVPLQYLDEIAALNLPMAEVGRDTRRAVFVKPTQKPAPPAQPYAPPVTH
jgi:4-amino-4-deoxy-L-arabinose transferase-like glycosyltransferase